MHRVARASVVGTHRIHVRPYHFSRILLSNQSPPPAMPPKKLSIKERIKEAAVHYWHGSKLLAAEIRISSKLLYKLTKGDDLIRREKRQLKRTTTDLIRLVPMSVFVIVPFMELLLPVALMIFPNMLPSTFEDKFAAEEKKKKELKVRLEMAKFLQETISEMAKHSDIKAANAAFEFSEFFKKYRTSGYQAPTDDIIKAASRFKEDDVLENLTRPQLASMCRYMNLKAFGTDNYLRYQIRNTMSQIKEDDKMIQAEGVVELTVSELQQACRTRGIKTIGVSPSRLRSELEQWLDLHLKHQIPSTLLILSKAFSISDVDMLEVEKDRSAVDALQATLSSLPDQVVDEANLSVSETEGKATNKQRLEVLTQQEELIADELEQEAKEKAARDEAKEAAKEAEKATVAETPEQPVEVSDEKVRITQSQLKELREVLRVLSNQSAVMEEREVLQTLKVAKDEQKEGDSDKTDKPTASRLSTRLDKMVNRIDTELEKYESEVGSRMNLIRPNERGEITSEDLENAFKMIRSSPLKDREGGDEIIKKIVKKIDVDADGYINLHELMSLGKELESEGFGTVEVKADQTKKVEEKGEKKDEKKLSTKDIVDDA